MRPHSYSLAALLSLTIVALSACENIETGGNPSTPPATPPPPTTVACLPPQRELPDPPGGGPDQANVDQLMLLVMLGNVRRDPQGFGQSAPCFQRGQARFCLPIHRTWSCRDFGNTVEFSDRIPTRFRNAGEGEIRFEILDNGRRLGRMTLPSFANPLPPSATARLATVEAIIRGPAPAPGQTFPPCTPGGLGFCYIPPPPPPPPPPE